jgi:NAD(P)-dependent dehydrogenase (short-subunit alcohol dehydrogenase family)
LHRIKAGTRRQAQSQITLGGSTEVLARTTYDHRGRIDVLVNNAAYFKEVQRATFHQLDVEEWDKAFAVDVRGV